MDERDVVISRIRAEMEEKDKEIKKLKRMIQNKDMVLGDLRKNRIEKLEKELTETRKRLVDTTQLFEEIRDAYTTMVGNIMTLREKYRSMETQAEVQDGKTGELEQGGLSGDLSAAHRLEG